MKPLPQIPPLSAERFEAMRCVVQDPYLQPHISGIDRQALEFAGVDTAIYTEYAELIWSTAYRKWLGQQASFWRDLYLKRGLGENHPLASCFGAFEGEPWADEWISAMEENRRKLMSNNNEIWFVAALYGNTLHHDAFPTEDEADRWLEETTGANKTVKVKAELEAK